MAATNADAPFMAQERVALPRNLCIHAIEWRIPLIGDISIREGTDC